MYGSPSTTENSQISEFPTGPHTRQDTTKANEKKFSSLQQNFFMTSLLNS